MKPYLLPVFCALLLSACQSPAPAKKPVPAKDAIEITGEATTSMSTTPIVPTDPNVQVYSTEGPVINPLMTDRTQSVLDNTTAGGYTVFDPSVKVYPLPGEDVPAYLPQYSVPPLDEQYKPEAPRIGQPVGLASAGMLPPVPNVDVKNTAARQPLSLTAPEPLTMQPPAAARPAMASPFPLSSDEIPPPPPSAAKPRAPKVAPVMDETPVPAAPSVTSEGRRSSPMLTGY